jgi:hypothetical protein
MAYVTYQIKHCNQQATDSYNQVDINQHKQNPIFFTLKKRKEFLSLYSPGVHYFLFLSKYIKFNYHIFVEFLILSLLVF